MGSLTVKMTLIAWSLVILCCFQLVSSKPILSSTTSHHAQPVTEENASRIATTQSGSSTTPVSSDHNKSTTGRSTTTAGHVIYSTGKVLVTAANLFVSGVQGMLGTDRTNTASEPTGLTTDPTEQAAITSSTSGQNEDEFTSSDRVTIGVAEGSSSPSTTESTTTSAGQMQSSETLESESAELTGGNMTVGWLDVTNPLNITADGNATVDSESVEFNEDNITVGWIDVSEPENQTPEEDTTMNWLDVTTSENQTSTMERENVTTEFESLADQTTASTTEGKYMMEYGTATGNNITSREITNTMDIESNDPADEVSTTNGQDRSTTELPTFSGGSDHVTTHPDTTELVTKSTQKRSITDEPSLQTSRQTVAAPQYHTSDACTNLRYLWYQASVTRYDTECAIEHYCSHKAIVNAISEEGNNVDCLSLARRIVADDPDVVFPNVADTLANGPSLHEILNIGLQAAIEHQYVINNISAMEEKAFCKIAHDYDIPCDANSNCQNPTQPDAQFFCDTYDWTSYVGRGLRMHIERQQHEMAELGIDDESNPNVDVQPLAEVKKELVIKYTLGGLYNTREQLCLIQKGLEAFCDDIPRSGCELEL